MRRFSLLILMLSAGCSFLMSSTLFAQTWQNSVGTTNNDLHWQGLANNLGYITVGQSDVASLTSGNTNVVVTQFDNNGGVLWSKVVSTGNNTGSVYRFEPRDIAAAPAAVLDNTTLTAGYYITGVIQNISPNVGTSMFVMRIDANANLVWLRQNVLPTFNITQSEGVAVVTLSSGDVIAVGNVLYSTGAANATNQVLATRITPNNTMLWSNVYVNTSATNATASITAHEATLNPNMTSCGITVPTPVNENGIVLTGEVANSTALANFGAGSHLFAMSIDANGNECWRNAYPVNTTTTQTMSSGHDITYDITTNNFVIAGRSYVNNATGVQNTTYIVRTSPVGAFVCGTLVHIAGNNNAFARSIAATNVAGTTGNIIVAGLNLTTNASYLMSFASNAGCPSTPTWVKEYLLPPAPAPTAVWTGVAGISGNGVPESLTITGTSPNTYNYFMTTNTRNSSSNTFDMHVIRTDVNGNTQTACPPVARTISNTSIGVLIDLAEAQIADDSWTNINAFNTNLSLTQNLCGPTLACTVNALFTASNSTAAPCTYLFTNASSGNGTLSYAWNFGDPNSGANNTSTATHPSHTFSASGSYNVCLVTTNTLSNGTTCTNTYCFTIQANCPTPCTVMAAFTETGSVPLSCHHTFTNNSTGNGTLSYYWDFGDPNSGTNNNTTVGSPIHTFSSSGSFTVCLTTTNTLNGMSCTNTSCQVVQVTNCSPVCTVNANFMATSPTTSPCTYTFTNSSTGNGTLTYAWDFGDPASGANNTSILANPTHTFSASGSYNVCLTVTNTLPNGTSCTSTYCLTIQVSCGNALCTVNADFTALGSANCTYSFTNTSTGNGTLTYAWDFGDPASGANNTSTLPNPTHTFSASGSYNVCLTVTNTLSNGTSCTDTYCLTIQVNCGGTACTTTAGFTHTGTCTHAFTNTSTGNGILTYAWDFGDPASGANNTSTLANPTHTFSASGAYVVCLTVTNTLSNGTSCTDTYCLTVQANCPTTVCTASSNYCYTVNGYQTTFNNSSTGNGALSYTWTFGDGTGSTVANPTKTYGAPGTYTVCLTVLNTLPDGTQCCNTCCKTITINPVCSVNSNFRYCVNGSQVTLTNASSTGVSYAWYLDNNTQPFSTLYTPPTQVLSVGTHTICLETTRNTTTGSCSKYTCKTVVINATCNVLARFSHTGCLNTLSATFNNSSTNATTYSWNFGDPNSGANNTSTATNPTHTFSSYGTYVVCLTAQSLGTANNSVPCRYRVCQTVKISQPNCTTACPQICPTCLIAPEDNGDAEVIPAAKSDTEMRSEGEDFINDGSDIEVFPNPTTDYVQVVYNSGDSPATVLKVSDIQGKIIKEIQLDATQQSIDIDFKEMPQGMYLLAIHHENGTISGAKLMKE